MSETGYVDPGFVPYALQCVVQSGTKVLIKGLASKKGKTLNGRTGMAREFTFKKCGALRWKVELDSDPADGDAEQQTGEEVSINIKNLELVLEPGSKYLINVTSRDNPYWHSMSMGGKIPLVAGAAGGDMTKPTLAIVQDKDGGYDIEEMKRLGSFLGMSDEYVGFVVALCNKLG